MKIFFEFLLPPVADNNLLAPDGGADSIAGMDLSVASAPGLLFRLLSGAVRS
jgi:hypothetical protein